MILVTGATGLVGSHLIKQLSLQQQPTLATYFSNQPIPLPFITWIKVDILDIVTLEEIFQNVTQVYHCAATVSFHPKQKEQLIQNNVQGTANVVNACINTGVKKLLFVSSVAALGRIRKDEWINESMQWTPETSNSLYGKTKYLAEMEVWRGIGEGLQAVIINPTIILGCSNWESGSTAIFKNAYHQFPWYTNGVSGFVGVDDVVRAMILLMNSEITAQRFIVSAWNLPYKTVFSIIAKAFGKKPPTKQVTPFLAALVWRLEAVKSWFTGKQPLLTKETAATAQAIVHFDNSKLLKQFPQFTYNSFEETTKKICLELKEKYQLH